MQQHGGPDMKQQTTQVCVQGTDFVTGLNAKQEGAIEPVSGKEVRS